MEVNSATDGSPIPRSNAFAQLDSSEFIRVMISELQNQDPFQPQDSSKLLEQMSSLRNIESQMTLQNQLQNLVQQNQVASAGNLIGKLVQGLGEDGQNLQGLVNSVRVTNNGVFLELDTGASLKMSQVTAIADQTQNG